MKVGLWILLLFCTVTLVKCRPENNETHNHPTAGEGHNHDHGHDEHAHDEHEDAEAEAEGDPHADASHGDHGHGHGGHHGKFFTHFWLSNFVQLYEVPVFLTSEKNGSFSSYFSHW